MANLASTTLTAGFTEKKGTSSVSGTTLTVDVSTGNYFEGDLASASGNIATFTISNPPSAGNVGSFKIKIKQGTTARVFNWGSMTGAEPQWVDGTAPAMPAEYQTYTVYSFTTYDGGTTWYGQVIATAFDRDTPSGPWGTRGVWGGGHDGTAPNAQSNVLSYVTIATTGNATDFGDLTNARERSAGVSSGSRGVFAGGVTDPGTNFETTIDYITIGSAGTATDFGDLTVGRNSLGGASSTTRGVFAGGNTAASPAHTNVMDYITIAAAGNATDFGDLTVARDYLSGTSNGTRALFGAGSSSGPTQNVIDYITIGSAGNATDFGDFTVARNMVSAMSDGIRAVWAGASTYSPIDYNTIETPGNSSSFGQLSVTSWDLSAGCSDGNRGVIGGGSLPAGKTNNMDYITINYASNGTDFGDLSAPARSGPGACSGS